AVRARPRAGGDSLRRGSLAVIKRKNIGQGIAAPLRVKWVCARAKANHAVPSLCAKKPAVAFLELRLVRLQRLASSLVAWKCRQFRDLSRCHEFVTGMQRDFRAVRVLEQS